MGLEAQGGGGGGAAFSQSSSVQTAMVATGETTASAVYVNLTTVGPAVTINIGPTGIAVVQMSAFCSNTVANDFGLFTFAASGGNVIAASDANAIQGTSFSAGVGASYAGSIVLTGLAIASTTFTLKYRTNGGTQTFSARALIVITY